MENNLLINVTDILMHASSHLNPRLMRHGERVAYLMQNMLVHSDEYSSKEKQNIFMLGFLHDIGVYRNSEIDAILSPDGPCFMEPSIYGYLLLKYFSPLSEYADCILYQNNRSAQYYSVPISPQHRRLAKLLYLADRLDVYILQNGPDSLELFFSRPDILEVFTKEELSFYLKLLTDRNILDRLFFGTYKKEIDNYTKNMLQISDADAYDYLMTFLLSVDFRSKSAALHTGYSIALCQSLTESLALTKETCQYARLACTLLQIGKVVVPPEVHTTSAYKAYLRRFYQPGIGAVIREILYDSASPAVVDTVDDSFTLLNYFLCNKRVPFSPSPLEEIIALSSISASSQSLFARHGRLQKEQLSQYLLGKYETCGLDTSLLQTLLRSYDRIVQKTGPAHLKLRVSYQSLTEEYHSLCAICDHYTQKYSDKNFTISDHNR